MKEVVIKEVRRYEDGFYGKLMKEDKELPFDIDINNKLLKIGDEIMVGENTEFEKIKTACEVLINHKRNEFISLMNSENLKIKQIRWHKFNICGHNVEIDVDDICSNGAHWDDDFECQNCEVCDCERVIKSIYFDGVEIWNYEMDNEKDNELVRAVYKLKGILEWAGWL